MTYFLVGFSAGILDNVDNSGSNINYLEFGSQGFIIAHEISHIVDQIVSSDIKSRIEFCFVNFISGFDVVHVTVQRRGLIGRTSEN